MGLTHSHERAPTHAPRQSSTHGGGRGIRTPGGFDTTAVFKTAPFNRSGIPPRVHPSLVAQTL